MAVPPKKSLWTSKASREELESELVSRFGDAVRQLHKPETAFMSTGIDEVDSLSSGLPRGAITEILGPASSGRTSLMLAMLAEATSREEVCALVDATDSLDAVSASKSGIQLSQLLWVRCGGNVRHALQATDLLLQSGGFGLVVLDLGDIATGQARKIQATWWHRFRRAIEKTPTAVVVIEREPNSRSAASLVLELKRENARWPAARRFAEPRDEYGASEGDTSVPLISTLLGGFDLHVTRKKPVSLTKATARVEASR